MADELTGDNQPDGVTVAPDAPRGKLDLLVNVDFRMTTTGLYSDVVLPAATWYEKYDLSMTDMHPFVHSFNQAVPPPWECRSDWDAFKAIAEAFSPLAAEHLGMPPRPRRHADRARHARASSPSRGGRARDWRAGECEPVPGRDDAQPAGRRARLRRASPSSSSRSAR